MADIHREVEGKVDECRGISFVDDITWVAEGDHLPDLTAKLERCAAKSLEWAEGNAVWFETSKTEAILLTRSKKLWGKKGRRPIRVGNQQVFFARGATRWLGVWLDSALSMVENRRKCMNRAREANARI